MAAEGDGLPAAGDVPVVEQIAAVRRISAQDLPRKHASRVEFPAPESEVGEDGGEDPPEYTRSRQQQRR